MPSLATRAPSFGCRPHVSIHKRDVMKGPPPSDAKSKHTPGWVAPLRSQRTALRARRIHANTRTRAPQWTSSLPFFDCEKGVLLGWCFFCGLRDLSLFIKLEGFFCVRGPALFSQLLLVCIREIVICCSTTDAVVMLFGSETWTMNSTNTSR